MIKGLTTETARVFFVHLVSEFHANLHVIAKTEHRSN